MLWHVMVWHKSGEHLSKISFRGEYMTGGEMSYSRADCKKRRDNSRLPYPPITANNFLSTSYGLTIFALVVYKILHEQNHVRNS